MKKRMTIDEASAAYKIPIEILKEYESWGLCEEVKKVMGDWKYDDSDLEKLSLIMTLHDIGFDTAEVRTYMELLLEARDTADERMRMLDEKRGKTLDEIHLREKQLDRLDYLRYKIRKTEERKTVKRGHARRDRMSAGNMKKSL